MRIWVFLLLITACGSNNNATPDGGGGCVDCPAGTICSANQSCIPDGTCAVDGDCGAGMKCDPVSGQCSVGGCGGQFLDLTYVPPNVLVVLDRSCSMKRELAGTTTTKWAAAVGSINNMLGTYSTDAHWGLTMFPDTTGNACSQDAIPFAIAPNNAASISSMLTSALDVADPNYPDSPCVTNIDTGVQQAALDPALADATRKSYLMLVSDGAQAGCTLGGGDAGAEAAIKELRTDRDITTFVVGFGSEVDAPELDKLATLGGAALPGATKYYQADTAAQLDAAFQSIVGAVVSCDYEVNPAPGNLDETYVFFENTELVPRDPSHILGWDYDPATMILSFYGVTCDRLKTRQVDDVDVVFGCPTPPVL